MEKIQKVLKELLQVIVNQQDGIKIGGSHLREIEKKIDKICK